MNDKNAYVCWQKTNKCIIKIWVLKTYFLPFYLEAWHDLHGHLEVRLQPVQVRLEELLAEAGGDAGAGLEKIIIQHNECTTAHIPVLKIRFFWVIVVIQCILLLWTIFEVVNYIILPRNDVTSFHDKNRSDFFVGSPYTVHTSIQEVDVSTHFSSKWRKSRFCSWRYPCWQRGRWEN